MKKLESVLLRIQILQSKLGIEDDTAEIAENAETDFEKLMKTTQFALKDYQDKINERFKAIKENGYDDSYRIKLDRDIRERYSSCDQNINNLDGYLRKNINKAEMQKVKEKENLITMFRKKLTNLQKLSKLKSSDEKPQEQTTNKQTYIVTNTASDLTQPINQSDEEKEAIENIYKEDKEIDSYLEQLVRNLEIFDLNMDNISVATSKMQKKIDRTKGKSEQIINKIEAANAKIKELNQKFGTPGKICIYVVLLVVILIVGCLIYNFVA